MREIGANEVVRLHGCLEALAAHHNRVSVHFKGAYPSQPYEAKLSGFADALERGSSRIAVVEEQGAVTGFCKVDLDGARGKLDYLIVLPDFRGRGYGRTLMDWAMAAFAEAGVHHVEVKVVDGNDTIHLYESYGFAMNAHILVREDGGAPEAWRKGE